MADSGTQTVAAKSIADNVDNDVQGLRKSKPNRSRAAGLSLTGVTVFIYLLFVVSLSKTHLSLLKIGSTQEDPSRHN